MLGLIGVFFIESFYIIFPECPSGSLLSCRSGDSLVVNSDPRPDLIFYSTTLVLYILIQIYFMRTLKTSYYIKYVSHRKMIFTQAAGMQLFLAVKVMLDIWQLTDFAGVQ